MPNKYVTRRMFSTIIILAVVLLVIVGSVRSQSVAIAQMSATIVTPVSVVATTSLQFGSVFQGVPKTVSRTAVSGDTTAAVFTVSGQSGAGLSLQLDLPSYMSNGAGDRLPISFSSSDLTVDSLAGSPDSPGAGAWVGVNPHNPPSVNIGAASGSTSLYLGGKITPATQQAPGTYTADIVVSVTYDGT